MTERSEIIEKLGAIIDCIERGSQIEAQSWMTLEQLRRVKSDVEFADFFYSIVEGVDFQEVKPEAGAVPR